MYSYQKMQMKYILYYSWSCHHEGEDKPISVYDTYEEAQKAAEIFAQKPLVWDMYGATYNETEHTRFTIASILYNLNELYGEDIEEHISVYS